MRGFTLVELMVVLIVVTVIASIAIPGLLRARQSGNEASAIASVRLIISGQDAYAVSCGGGGYAQTNDDLGKKPIGGPPFIPDDLRLAAVSPKSGYFVAVRLNLDPTNGKVLSAAQTCNGAAADTMRLHFVAADPQTRGETGVRSFAADNRSTVYYDPGATVANPIPDGSALVQ